MKRPTPTEVTEYAKTIGFVIDGEKFCAHYEARGWRYGRADMPMKSWKGAVRVWKCNQGGFGIGKVQSKVGTTGGFKPSKESVI